MVGYFFRDGLHETTNNCNACGEDLQKHPILTRVGDFHVKCSVCMEMMEIIRPEDRLVLKKWFKKTKPSFALLGSRKYETV